MPRPIIVAASIAAVLVLGACGNTDANEDDVHDILTEAGATEEQADCAARDIADDLTQGELNDLAAADTPGDIPEDISDTVTPILDRCLAEGGPAEDEDTDSSTTTVADGEDDADTTTTTAASGDTTTTTIAGGTTTTVAGG